MNQTKTLRTYGLGPAVVVDDNSPLTTSVGLGVVKKKQNSNCGVTIVTKITTVWPNVKKLQRSSSTKRPNMGPVLFQRKGFILSFQRNYCHQKAVKTCQSGKPQKEEG
jgi:hypothetical protein